MKRKYLHIVLLSFLIVFTSCKNSEEENKNQKATENNFSKLSEAEKKDFNTSTWIKISTHGDTQTFASACVSASIAGDLMDLNDITIFAPTNKAFEIATVEQKTILHDVSKREELQEMLKTYIIPQKLNSVDIVQALKGQEQIEYENLAGKKTIIVKDDMELYLLNEKGDSSLIVLSDLKASNGVVHVMKKLL